jgi:hypothetical protein
MILIVIVMMLHDDIDSDTEKYIGGSVLLSMNVS